VPNARHSREGGNPASFARYPKYKNSGVEWLGEVPTHWKVERIKASVASCRNGIWGSEESGNDDDIPCVRVADFDRARLVVDQAPPTIRNVSAREREGRLLSSGNLLLEKSGGGEGQPVGCVVLYNCGASTVCSNFVARMELSSDMVPSFWRYVHAAAYAVRLTTRSINQTSGIQNLDQDRYFNERAAFPSVEEQSAIAAFLDRETTKIDALIAEQEKLIALLKEKRQALISRAVTKGLDPSAPMKDSGIEWLGDVPTHWEVKQIKRLTIVQRGASPRPIDDPKYFDDEGRYAWVRIADVSASDGHLRETTQRLSELGSSLSVRLAPGSLFISIAGTVGKPCITDIEACIHDGFVYFPTLNLDPMFLYRVFEAGGCYGGLGKFGTQLNLNTDTIGSICVAVPPQRELVAVLAHLDQTTAAIDSLTREAVHAVDLLKDRRNALISAAVTGKIDVRDASWSLNEVRRAIKWGAPRQPAPDWDCEPDAVIWVSVSKLDAAWEAAGEDYIGHGGIGASIDGRYERFGAWLRKNSGPVELPVVAMDDGNKLGFVDGRHRFAWLRDHGVRAMPVQVEVAQQQIFESQFGSTERESIISEQGYLV
jgi:type I restriction enzyme S subunit